MRNEIFFQNKLSENFQINLVHTCVCIFWNELRKCGWWKSYKHSIIYYSKVIQLQVLTFSHIFFANFYQKYIWVMSDIFCELLCLAVYLKLRSKQSATKFYIFSYSHFHSCLLFLYFIVFNRQILGLLFARHFSHALYSDFQRISKFE